MLIMLEKEINFQAQSKRFKNRNRGILEPLAKQQQAEARTFQLTKKKMRENAEHERYQMKANQIPQPRLIVYVHEDWKRE